MNDLSPDPAAVALRRAAEAALAARPKESDAPPTEAQHQRLIHELQVHQIELEMQNDALRASRQEEVAARARATELYNLAPTGYVTVLRDGTATMVNTAAARLLGGERHILLQKRLGLFVAVADRATLNRFLEQVFAGTGRQLCEVTLGEPSTATRIVQIEGTLSPSREEAHLSLIDVSFRRHAEAALCLRDRAIRAVSQGIVITDPNLPDNPIIYVNPGFELVTGYSAAEVVGRNCRFLQGKETESEPVDLLRTALADGHACAVELLNYRKDGTAFWNALFLTPVRDEDGALVQFIGVMLDVTERRALELALQQSQRIEAVGQLAGGVAHDFNNLLSVINGYSDIVLSELATEHPLREMVREIGHAGARAALLTRQLLTFSRKQVPDLKVHDINVVVRDLGRMLRRLIGEDIGLTINLHPGALHVMVDAGQVEQVLMNLVLNARDAMPRGGTVTITTTAMGAVHEDALLPSDLVPGPHVVVTVADTGAGMDAATRERIFEPFFTTKGMGRGTGLGLSMVYGIVKQSRGAIAVASTPGEGSSFRIFLPIVPSPDEGPRTLAIAALAPRGHETVLVVEDEPSVRALTHRILSMQGYLVLEAGMGEEALQVLADHPGPIELLLTDVVMPTMGGRELAERVRALRPEMRVMFVSGYNSDDVLRHGIVHAEEAFLQKPFTPVGLAVKVREVLDAR